MERAHKVLHKQIYEKNAIIVKQIRKNIHDTLECHSQDAPRSKKKKKKCCYASHTLCAF